MANTEINVVGLASSKKGNGPNWKIIGAIIGIIILALGIVAGILLVKQQQDVRERAQISSCVDPTVEQCPVAGKPDTLRNCHPPQSDNSPLETICNEEGKVAFCGNKNYCCPSIGASWTTDMTACTLDVFPKVSLTPPEAEVACTQGFTDDFTTIDATKWNKEGDVTVDAGVLVVKRDEPGTTSYDGLYTKNSFTGNFVVEVDVPEVIKTGDGAAGAAILFTTDTTDGLSVVRARKNNRGGGGVWQVSSRVNVGTNFDEGVKTLATGPVTFKIERSAGKFTIYYKTGGNYVLLDAPPLVLTKPIQAIHLSAINTEYVASENVLVKYDNFKVTCSGGPTATATATATATGNRTATPTATATATGNRTATPTPAPKQCNQLCNSNPDCRTGLICSLISPQSGEKRCRKQACTGETDCICNSETATPTGNRTATPTATATATPTATSTGTGLRTATARSTATATSTSAPIPVTGMNTPTIVGAGFGIFMIIASLLLAL